VLLRCGDATVEHWLMRGLPTCCSAAIRRGGGGGTVAGGGRILLPCPLSSGLIHAAQIAK